MLGLEVKSLAEWKEQFCPTIFFLRKRTLPSRVDSACFFFSSLVSFPRYMALGSKDIGEGEDEDGARLESVLDFRRVWISCSQVLPLGLSGAHI
jgi:hypothetical protein